MVLFVTSCKYESKGLVVEEDLAEDVLVPLYLPEFGTKNNLDTKAGVRDEAIGFATGDRIGVTAYYSQKTTEISPNSDSPKFTDAPQFLNVPAKTIEGVTAEGIMIQKLQWDVDQFFDGSKNIFLYAYYPYSNGTDSEGVTFVRKKSDGYDGPDMVKVEMQDETIDATSTTVVQPDVMVACLAQSINRRTKDKDLLVLKFGHVLAQLQFSVIKDATVDGNPKFVGITFKGPKTAVFNLGTPDQYISCSATQTVNYTVKNNTLDPISTTVQVVNPAKLLVLPYDSEDIAKCELALKVNFDNYGEVEYKIPLAGALNSGFARGGLNNVVITIKPTGITLGASVKEWLSTGIDEIIEIK